MTKYFWQKKRKKISKINVGVKMVKRKPRISNILGPSIIHYYRGQNQKMGLIEIEVIMKVFLTVRFTKLTKS